MDAEFDSDDSHPGLDEDRVVFEVDSLLFHFNYTPRGRNSQRAAALKRPEG